MLKKEVRYFDFEGTHYEIGRQIAEKIKRPGVKIPTPEAFTDADVQAALNLYDEYCPGIREELDGFTEETGIRVRDIPFTWMTYLLPCCCGIVLPGSMMGDGHTRLARNYEFNPDLEDLAVIRVKAKGKYHHIGGSAAVFGRTEGVNECGLAVSMSSCGMPVSNMPGMRKAAIKGLQFWAVIRSLLDNCSNVAEALQLTRSMPIAYNINLCIADSSGNAVLLETMDGKCAWEEISQENQKQFLYATNHIAIKSMQHREPAAMRNSIIRFEKIEEFMHAKTLFKEKEIRDFLLTEYPEGMTAHYHKDFFGTIKSVVMDTVERRYSICWFGLPENGWEDLLLSQPLIERSEQKSLVEKQPLKEFFEFIPLAGNTG